MHSNSDEILLFLCKKAYQLLKASWHKIRNGDLEVRIADKTLYINDLKQNYHFVIPLFKAN